MAWKRAARSYASYEATGEMDALEMVYDAPLDLSSDFHVVSRQHGLATSLGERDGDGRGHVRSDSWMLLALNQPLQQQ